MHMLQGSCLAQDRVCCRFTFILQMTELVTRDFLNIKSELSLSSLFTEFWLALYTYLSTRNTTKYKWFLTNLQNLKCLFFSSTKFSYRPSQLSFFHSSACCGDFLCCCYFGSSTAFCVCNFFPFTLLFYHFFFLCFRSFFCLLPLSLSSQAQPITFTTYPYEPFHKRITRTKKFTTERGTHSSVLWKHQHKCPRFVEPGKP